MRELHILCVAHFPQLHFVKGVSAARRGDQIGRLVQGWRSNWSFSAGEKIRLIVCKSDWSFRAWQVRLVGCARGRLPWCYWQAVDSHQPNYVRPLQVQGDSTRWELEQVLLAVAACLYCDSPKFPIGESATSASVRTDPPNIKNTR